MPTDFAELLERARQGDASALTELVRQYEPEIRLAARVRLGPALRPYVDSMDLVQSVHGSLIRGLRQNRFDFSSPEELLALAVTLVRNKVARCWRRARRQVRPSPGGDDGRGVEQLLISLSSPGDDPVRVAQFRDQVRHLCGSLDETDRRLVELRLQGHSTAEAARQLGLNADVLRVRLSRLRQRLETSGVLTEWL
jgi:RNA polymerase sigma factor (sigma-70 family)